MAKLFRKLGVCLLALTLLLSMAIPALAAGDINYAESAVPKSDEYYAEALKAEIYNFKMLRNMAQTFEKESYDKYYTAANLVLKINEIGDAQKIIIDNAIIARKALVQKASVADSVWPIWGETIAKVEADDVVLEFEGTRDNADFIPTLVPYLLADQTTVKGNMILIPGGGYSDRNNEGEGWPVAEEFNKLGYNAYVLQRRVAPYVKEDSFLDLQRTIRYLRFNAEKLGLGGMDCIAAAGFSGGGGTTVGTVQYLYGDVQPSFYDADYVSDEVDAMNADLDVAFIIYSGNANFTSENPNLPAMFFAVGEEDRIDGNIGMAAALRGKTMVESHTFATVGHGFGVGATGTNSMLWIPMADNFMQTATVGLVESPIVADVVVPEKYTKWQKTVHKFAFGDKPITIAMNDDESAFYLYFEAFQALQLLEGTIENGVITVTYDLTGFMAGDAPALLGEINEYGWFRY